MKKMLFFVWDDIHKNPNGVNKKIISQINNFICSGISCDYEYISQKKGGFINSILARLPFFNVNPKWKYIDKYSNYDCIYLRRPYYLNGFFISFLKKIKKKNQNVKIMYEIPTYPYDGELNSRLLNYPLFWKDKFYRKKLKKVVDRIVTLNNDKKIWGIDTLQISNGIDVSLIPVRHPIKHDGINLISVAYFMDWHGMERLIYGLDHYYNSGSSPKTPVNLYLIGSGDELVFYDELCKKYSVSNYVHFIGEKKADELVYYFDICDIGVCSLGAYKKKLFYSRELKSREYASRGLPIISGVHLDLFDMNYPVYKEYQNTSNEINIYSIVSFYNDNIFGREIELTSQIRSFAEKELSMSNCMKSVVDYINKNEGEY